MEPNEEIIKEIERAIEKRFNESVPMLQELIAKRKNSWTLTSVMEWQDVSSIILTRLYRNFYLYDPSQPLDRWANTAISNALKNLVRDHIVRYLKPCSAANSYGARCAFNEGQNKCGWTKSGIQDSTCKFYANWEKKKRSKLAIASPLSLDAPIGNSETEMSLGHITPSAPGSFLDIEGAKEIIDVKIVKYLDKEEIKVYRLLYIKHLTPKQVGKKMGYKVQQNSDVPGYLKIRKFEEKVYALASQIIKQEGLA